VGRRKVMVRNEVIEECDEGSVLMCRGERKEGGRRNTIGQK
jgi:hypothetical protein